MSTQVELASASVQAEPASTSNMSRTSINIGISAFRVLSPSERLATAAPDSTLLAPTATQSVMIHRTCSGLVSLAAYLQLRLKSDLHQSVLFSVVAAEIAQCTESFCNHNCHFFPVNVFSANRSKDP